MQYFCIAAARVPGAEPHIERLPDIGIPKNGRRINHGAVFPILPRKGHAG